MTTLDTVMPIPSRTASRMHPWPTICRAYCYEGIERAADLSRFVNGLRSPVTIREIRCRDKWKEWRETASARETALKHGLSLPFLLREQSMTGQIEDESDKRAPRAAAIQRLLQRVLDRLAIEHDVGGPRFGRLVQTVGALQAQLDALLGLDVAKRVGQAAAIARTRAGLRTARHQPRPLPDALRHPAPAVHEPDVMTLLP